MALIIQDFTAQELDLLVSATLELRTQVTANDHFDRNPDLSQDDFVYMRSLADEARENDIPVSSRAIFPLVASFDPGMPVQMVYATYNAVARVECVEPRDF